MDQSRRYEQEQRSREPYERRGADRNWEWDSERTSGGLESDRWMDSPGQIGERDSSRTWRGTGAGSYGGGYQGTMRENYSGRGPKGFQRSDDRIRDQVCERLTDDFAVDASNIEVEVRNCEVTLKGTVRDREQKRRAEDLAESCSGVSDVTNNIQVATADSLSQSQTPEPTHLSQ